MLAKDLEEIEKLFQFSQREGIPMTFRAAGSSLSGQSISDGLLVEVARNWRDCRRWKMAERKSACSLE